MAKRIQKTKTARNASLMAAAGVAALAGAAWYYRREWMSLLGFLDTAFEPRVQAQVPIAKDLPTIADEEANYDIDGVSFDSEGVIVGSDKQFETEFGQQVHR